MDCNGQFFKFSMRIFEEIAKTDCQEKTQQILCQLSHSVSFVIISNFCHRKLCRHHSGVQL